MMGTVFHHHPYGHSIIGYESDLRRITRDELYGHYRRYYVPNNAVVVASGDFNAEELFKKIEAKFGPFPPGKPRQRLKQSSQCNAPSAGSCFAASCADRRTCDAATALPPQPIPILPR